MINMLRKGIKVSIQRVYFPQSYFVCRHYSKHFNSIEKFKSLTFQLRAIYFHTFADDMTVLCRATPVSLFEFTTRVKKQYDIIIYNIIVGSCALNTLLKPDALYARKNQKRTFDPRDQV